MSFYAHPDECPDCAGAGWKCTTCKGTGKVCVCDPQPIADEEHDNMCPACGRSIVPPDTVAEKQE